MKFNTQLFSLKKLITFYSLFNPLLTDIILVIRLSGGGIFVLHNYRLCMHICQILNRFSLHYAHFS